MIKTHAQSDGRTVKRRIELREYPWIISPANLEWTCMTTFDNTRFGESAVGF